MIDNILQEYECRCGHLDNSHMLTRLNCLVAGCSCTVFRMKETSVSEIMIVTRSAAPDKSPMLTALEKVVYNFCVETGDQPGPSVAEDPALHRLLVEAIQDQLRVDRIEKKLKGNVVWLQKQLAKKGDA